MRALLALFALSLLAAHAGNPPSTAPITLTPLYVPGLEDHNHELQQLKDLRSILRLQSRAGRALYGRRPVAAFFETVGAVYRQSGFNTLGRAIERVGPLVERLTRMHRGARDIRLESRDASRRWRGLERALKQNRRMTPKFRKDYYGHHEGVSVVALVLGPETHRYPNYTGLALALYRDLGIVSRNARRDRGITRGLGRVPRNLWMTVTTGSPTFSVIGPLVAGGYVHTGSNSSATFNEGAVGVSGLNFNGGTVRAGANGHFVSTFRLEEGATVPSGYNLVALPGNAMIPWGGMRVDVEGETIEVPDGYLLYLIPISAELSADAVHLAGPETSPF